jgi:hypothetical protein
MSVRLLTIFIIIAALISGTSAYIITIEAPESVTLGSPLIVTGSTSFPENSYFDLVLFYSKYTAGELKRIQVIVDESQQFRADFDTRDLEKGQYKIEVHSIMSDGKEFVESSLGSSSVIRRVVKLVDRSDEIGIESSRTQNISTALVVTGRVKGSTAGVVTLRAFGPDDYTYGPQQIITTRGYADKDGHFSTLVPVSSPGDYQISLSDKGGFIGEYLFSVIDDKQVIDVTPESTPAPFMTPLSTPVETLIPPTETPRPATTATPVPSSLIIGGIIGGYLLMSVKQKK